MKKFSYAGEISASKSLMNRALIIQSQFRDFKIKGDSACEDVLHMRNAIANFPEKAEIDCGDAGTVLRFMGIRASKEKGIFRLKGTSRLFRRPQDDLLFVLNQLQVKADLLPNELVIHSRGWKKPIVPLRIHREKSSQFATGLLLSCWDLPFPLQFELTPVGLKDSYWTMSLRFAEMLGMKIEMKSKDRFHIPAGQVPNTQQIEMEPDYSSVFSVAAAAALSGQAHIENVKSTSAQPDYAFIEILQKMRVPILLENNVLGVLKAPRLLPIQVSLQETPDLFPILGTLCAFAEGESRLIGAPRLAYKESHRIEKTAELLRRMGVKSKILSDGLHIQGAGQQLTPRDFEFDPDHDHRMAMAAGILIRAGWNIKLKSPEVVKKSFPEFWNILGLSL